MSDHPAIPAPTPVLIALLTDLLPAIGDRVSIVLLSPLPALRVAKIGEQQGVSDWSVAPMYQIEVWAEDELGAEEIAYALKNTWPHAGRQRVGDGMVHGRWVVQDPMPLPADDDQAKTDLARYLLTVAFRMTGASNG